MSALLAGSQQTGEPVSLLLHKSLPSETTHLHIRLKNAL